MNRNEHIVMGHVGRDPEVRYTTNGSQVATFSVAVTNKYKKRDGRENETTEWINVKAWGRMAEYASKFVRQGVNVLVIGPVETQSWEDKQGGGKKYRTETKALTLKVLVKESAEQGEERPERRRDRGGDPPPPPQEELDDEIPF